MAVTVRKTIEQKLHPKSTLYNSGSIRNKVVRATWNMATSGDDKAVNNDIIVLAQDLDPSLTIVDLSVKNTAMTGGSVKLGLRTSPQGAIEKGYTDDDCVVASLSVAEAANASIFPADKISGKTLAELIDRKSSNLMGVDLILTVAAAPSAAGTASFKIEFSEL